MNGPVLTIVAGSNGSGKSSLTSFSRTNFQQMPILDPDAIARSIQASLTGESSDIEAGKQALRHAEEFIAGRQSFTVETTLSGSTSFAWQRGQKMRASLWLCSLLGLLRLRSTWNESGAGEEGWA